MWNTHELHVYLDLHPLAVRKAETQEKQLKSDLVAYTVVFKAPSLNKIPG
jgi:hypothetical protein